MGCVTTKTSFIGQPNSQATCDAVEALHRQSYTGKQIPPNSAYRSALSAAFCEDVG
jgi:hypothetical protein